MAGSINRVIIVGNLTRDPELRATPTGMSVCGLRVAVNDRVKDPNTGEWGDKPNYFNVSIFGQQGERYAEWLTKGRQVAIDGRLRWREWQTQDGQKRESVEIVADNVQMIGPRDGGGGQGGGDWGGAPRQQRQGTSTTFNDTGLGAPPASDFADDDDIPF